MILPRRMVPIDPRARRRWWGGVGLVALGGALVGGSAITLASGVYQVNQSQSGGGLSGGGTIQLTFTLLGPPTAVLGFWVALGLVPLLAIVFPRARWPAFGVSVALGFFVGMYVVALLLGPFPLPMAFLALGSLMLSGACLNCVGALLLYRKKNRAFVNGATIVRVAKGTTVSAPEETLQPTRD